MKITKKLLSLLLAVAMLLSVASVISGCGKDPAGNEDPTDPANVEKDSYTVTIKTAGGMPMIGVAAYIYADATLSDLKDYGETDENGTVSFNLPVGTDYAIDLKHQRTIKSIAAYTLALLRLFSLSKASTLLPITSVFTPLISSAGIISSTSTYTSVLRQGKFL